MQTNTVSFYSALSHAPALCRAAAILGALVLAPAMAFSQTAARQVMAQQRVQQNAAPLELTLKQAVQIALRQNPSVQIALLNLAESRRQSGIALSQLLPQAEFNLSDRAVRANVQASIGLNIPGVPKAVGPFQVFQTGADFSAPIFDLSLWRRWQAARQGIASASAQSLSVRQQIVLLVVSQYLSALRAGAEIGASESRVNLAQALYNQTSDMEKNGVATSVDVLRANVELQNEKQALLVAQTDQQVALYGLAQLLNVPPLRQITLTDQMTFFETPKVSMDQSIADAYKSRPEIQQLMAQRRSLKYDEEADSESRLPALDFTGDYEQQGLSSSTIIPTYVYQAGITIPIFTGGRIHNEIARDRIELRKIDHILQNEKNEVALQVETAAARLESARHQVKVADLGAQLAQEEVQQSRDRFKAGVVDNIEVIAAQSALARADENQIAALYEYNQSRADLAHAIGRIEMLYDK